jgi:hypothetical protein
MTAILDRLRDWLAPYVLALLFREASVIAVSAPAPQWHPLPPDDLAVWRRVVEAIEEREAPSR